MAQGKGNASTATSEGGAPVASGEGEGAKKVRANRSYIVVPMPGDLKARFESEAKAADKPVGPYVLQLLASQLGIEIPVSVTSRRSKYANDDERKAAQKARNATRSGTMRDLMAAFREAQKAGKTPEESAQIASQKMLELMQKTAAQGAGTNGAAAPTPAEAQPATA